MDAGFRVKLVVRVVAVQVRFSVDCARVRREAL